MFTTFVSKRKTATKAFFARQKSFINYMTVLILNFSICRIIITPKIDINSKLLVLSCYFLYDILFKRNTNKFNAKEMSNESAGAENLSCRPFCKLKENIERKL